MGLRKGQTNNPNGRPKKGNTITELINAKLNKQLFVERLIEMAIPKAKAKTDFQALKLILNYIDGMPVQKQQIEIDNDKVERFKMYLNEGK